MVVWCLVLFVLGAAAFMDTQFNYGEIFRQVNSVFFMAMSLGLLYRITTKVRKGEREALIRKVQETERQLAELNTESAGEGVNSASRNDTPQERTTAETAPEFNTA